MNKFLHRYCPQSDITVVEIDPRMPAVAAMHFRLPAEDERLRIVIDDGAKFVAESDKGVGPRPVSVQNAYNLLNRIYEYGLSEVSLRDYTIGLIGILPGTILFCGLGALAGDVARFPTVVSCAGWKCV